MDSKHHGDTCVMKFSSSLSPLKDWGLQLRSFKSNCSICFLSLSNFCMIFVKHVLILSVCFAFLWHVFSAFRLFFLLFDVCNVCFEVGFPLKSNVHFISSHLMGLCSRFALVSHRSFLSHLYQQIINNKILKERFSSPESNLSFHSAVLSSFMFAMMSLSLSRGQWTQRLAVVLRSSFLPSAIYHHGNLHQLFSSCMDTNLLCSSAAVNLPKTSSTPQHRHTGWELNPKLHTHTPADNSGVCECERVCVSCVEY